MNFWSQLIESHRSFIFVDAIIIMTNESSTSIVQVPSVTMVKSKPCDDNSIFLVEFEDVGCVATRFLNTSHFPYKTKTPLVNKYVNVDKSPCNPLYMRLIRQGSPSQCPPLHLGSSSLGLNVVEALKLTKYRRQFESNTTTIDFNSACVCDVKCLPPSFSNDGLFVLPLCQWMFVVCMDVL